jgi:hypothetical protein
MSVIKISVIKMLTGEFYAIGIAIQAGCQSIGTGESYFVTQKMQIVLDLMKVKGKDIPVPGRGGP